MRDRKGVDSVGRGSNEELGGVEEGKAIITIHCVRKKNLFSIKEKKHKQTEIVSWFSHGVSLLRM